MVNDVPLRFFHFSGYDFRRPELISKFQNRFTFADRPDIAPLFQLYGERIRRQGQETVQDFPYQYGRFDNGVRVPEVAAPHPAAGRSRGEGVARSVRHRRGELLRLAPPAGRRPAVGAPAPPAGADPLGPSPGSPELLPPPLAGGPRPLRRLVRRQHRRAGEHRSGVHRGTGADAAGAAVRRRADGGAAGSGGADAGRSLVAPLRQLLRGGRPPRPRGDRLADRRRRP